MKKLNDAVYGAVNGAVNGAVGRAVYGAVRDAIRNVSNAINTSAPIVLQKGRNEGSDRDQTRQE